VRADQPRIPFTSIPCTSIPQYLNTQAPAASKSRRLAATEASGNTAAHSQAHSQAPDGPATTPPAAAASASAAGAGAGAAAGGAASGAAGRLAAAAARLAVERKALAVLSGHSIVRLLLVGVAQPREVLAGRGDDDGAVDPLAKPSLPAFCSLLCKRRFVSDDSAARNGRTASVSAIECRVVQPAGGESVGVAPHRRCTVRNGAGLRPALKVKVWAAQPAPRASVRCPLPPSVVWRGGLGTHV